MNREDLSWALSAVLPHVGKCEPLDAVGLHYADDLYAYATDRYTLAIARIPDGPHLSVRLAPSEARDLERFVRPTLVATKTEDVAIGQRPGELHVGVGDDSAVFDVTEGAAEQFGELASYCRLLLAAPVEWDELIFQPALLSRFVKANRGESTRFRMHPRRMHNRNGAALITVGEDFVGAVAGLTYDQIGTEPIASFLQNAERGAA